MYQVGRYRSIKMIRANPMKSDQVKPNPTKSDEKNGPARIKAQAVGSKLARTSLDMGRARWMQANAERMNEKAEGLGDRNTLFIYDTDERGSGLEEILRLCSLKFAYLRLSSLNGRKNVEPFGGTPNGCDRDGRAPQIQSGVSRVEESALYRRKAANRQKMRGAPTKLSRRFRDFSLTVGGSPVTSSA